MRPLCCLAAAAAFLVVAAAGATTIAGVAVPPPLPPKPVVDVHWGVKVEDPFRYFENTKDPVIQAWMKAHADATEAIMARIPGRDPLLARMREIESRASGLAFDAERSRTGRYFFQKRDPKDNQFRLVWRESAGGPDRVLLDPEQLSKKTGTPHAVMDFAPSPDGRLIAYAVQAGGGEIGTMHVVEVDSGKEVFPPIDRIRYASATWLPDSSGLFYSRLREGYESLPPSEKFADRTVYFRSLKPGAVEQKVFSHSHNPELKLPDYASGVVFQIPDTKLAGAVVFLGVERHVLFYVAELDDATRGVAKWRQVIGKDDEVAEAWAAGGYLYVRTSKDAPRFRVLRITLKDLDLAKAETVLPASESVITNIRAAQDALYVVRRDGATQSLWRLPHASKSKLAKVHLPIEGSISFTDGWGDRDGVLMILGGWTRATKPYQYDPKTKLTALPFVAKGDFDAPGDIVAREVRVKSHDGVEVPLSIISRKDIKLDGANPTILYGYGAYGVTDDPYFNPRIYAWLERGGVWAVAHVRGGGAFGEDWHMAGRKTTKPNTWKDAIATAEWLIANGYTSSGKLGILGGSAGGIFVGRSITERPELFAAAVPMVGVFDAMRFEFSANGVANVPEFGSVKNEEEFRALMAMSTYHAIRDGTPYPGVLLVHGVNDIRVEVWESLKTGARFSQASSSGRPVLMRLEYDSGHGQGSTRVQLQARMADVMSFMLWQFGDPRFQPRAAP